MLLIFSMREQTASLVCDWMLFPSFAFRDTAGYIHTHALFSSSIEVIMKVAFVASECTPFAKTGGLADVVGALPKALAQLGCDVKVFIPKYDSIDENKHRLHYEYRIGEMPVRVAGAPWPVHVVVTTLPGSKVPLYLIDCPHFFHRGRIYTNDFDEDGRFVLFTKAVIETLQRLQWAPDVLHCNDWQTGLLPLLLKDNYGWDRLFDATATLFTIHNIGYQGLFGRSALEIAEIDPRHTIALAMNDGVSFMKAGIVFADLISTVSETYAHEILTPQFGAGLENILAERRSDLHGILNGIDMDEWNPERDAHLPYHYSKERLEGKYLNKKYLKTNIGLNLDSRLPLIGMVSRLVAQKGFDLVAEAIDSLMELDAQWVILGSGEARYERLFLSLHHMLPHKLWTYIGFNTELAHLIEAAADMFLMPSHYEPCGLNQMYSLRYGTVPIVRRTGGLADTVLDWHEYQSKSSDEGNGFSFNDATGEALFTTTARAVDIYLHDMPTWHRIMMNGMNANFSWEASARKYMALYEQALTKRRV